MTEVVAVRDQLREIPAGERVAAGEDDELAVAERRGVIKELLSLVGRQLVRVTLRLRVGPAVTAGEPSRLCHLPDQHEGSPVHVEVVEHVPASRYDLCPLGGYPERVQVMSRFGRLAFRYRVSSSRSVKRGT